MEDAFNHSQPFSLLVQNNPQETHCPSRFVVMWVALCLSWIELNRTLWGGVVYACALSCILFAVQTLVTPYFVSNRFAQAAINIIIADLFYEWHLWFIGARIFTLFAGIQWCIDKITSRLVYPFPLFALGFLRLDFGEVSGGNVD